MRSRLWVRLAAIFVVGSVVPILGAGVLTVRILEGSVREDARARHLALADLSGSLVRDSIQRANEKLTTVSRLLAKELSSRSFEDVGQQADYRSAVVSRLDNLVEPPDAYLELQFYAAGNHQPRYVAGAQQRGGYRSGHGPDERSQMARNFSNAEQPIVREPALENRAFVAPQPDPNFGSPTLAVSVPVTADDGKTSLGAVVAYLDWKRLGAILGTVAQAGYHVTLSGGDGHALAEAGAFEGDAIGETRPAGHSDWTIAVAEPATRVYATLGHVKRQVALGTGLAVLLAAILSIAISAWIVTPVAALTRAARAMEAGDLKARTRIVRRDEIGELALAFDTMAASLEQLDAAKSDFVASVSHELRTPLTAMRLSIANLLDQVLGPLDAKQSVALTRLRGDVDRLILLVNDLLEMARLEAGAVAPRRERCDLATLARECAAGLEPLARQKSIAIAVSGEGEGTVDRSMIHRVLANLIDNAVKFTPEGGAVHVVVSGASFVVSDTGPGVPDGRLFTKFAQGMQDGVKARGAGLGLAIVKKLIELHGGTVTVENEGGARFTVKL